MKKQRNIRKIKTENIQDKVKNCAFIKQMKFLQFFIALYDIITRAFNVKLHSVMNRERQIEL